MRFTYPSYYKEFKCLAGACPDTCCAGWQIVIDAKSQQKYRRFWQSGRPFGNRLMNGIDWESGCFCQDRDKRCEFLNEEQLCDIYIEAGPQLLCATCQTYPRHIEEFEEEREYSLALSCPEAARIILELPELPTLVRTEDTAAEVYEEFDNFLYSALQDTRALAFQILRQRDWQLADKMHALLQLGETVQQAVDDEQIFAIEGLLAAFQAQLAAPADPAVEDLQHFAAALWQAMQQRFEILQPAWSAEVTELLAGLEQLDAAAYTALCTRFAAGYPSWEREGPQLLWYWLYTYFCGAVYGYDPGAMMNMAVVNTLFVRELALARFAANGGQITRREVRRLCVKYSRELEHSEENLAAMEKMMAEVEIR